MNKRFIIVILHCIIIPYLHAQKSIDAIDDFFTGLYKNGQFNGNVLIADNGIIEYEKSFGYANLSDKVENSKQTKFPIASITKAFTGTAVLQLYEKGKLKLNDPVAKYLQDFPYKSIEIKHLLSHTSGLQPYDNYFDELRKQNPEKVFTNLDILQRYAVLKLPLFYQPGDDCNYDNINYVFLALVVEKVSGITLKEYFKRYIFYPAKMFDTIIPEFTFYHYSNKEKKNLADTYWQQYPYSNLYSKTDTTQFVSRYWHSYNFKGFGEIISTLTDLQKFDKALYDGTLLNNQTLKIAYAPVLLNNGQPNKGFNTGNSFTSGWTLLTDTTFGKIIRASGGMIGLRSTLLRNISRHQTIIIIDNTQNETDKIAFDALRIINGLYVKPYGKSLSKEFGITLENDGKEKALRLVDSLKVDSLHYSIDENEFNSLGYAFMNSNKIQNAIETFKLNTELFPDSWNVYDSYGEALLRNGQKNEALQMYKTSLEINPENENAKKIINDLKYK
jgi:CubicO group peptidase (beta-lactamase class C family)